MHHQSRPLIPLWQSVEMFLLPPSQPSNPVNTVLHAQWIEPDFRRFSETVLESLAAGIPNGASFQEEINGYPLRGVRNESGEVLALAEKGGIWI